MNTPIEMTEYSSTMTPSTISDRAPMKQLSSMIVGLAWTGSSTPPIPTPPDRWTPLPIWAQEPTVAHVSTIVPSSTYAPMFTYDGIRIAPLAIKQPRRATAGGTTRTPLFFISSSVEVENLVGTLS